MPTLDRILIQRKIEELQMQAEAKYTALMDLQYRIFALKRRLEEGKFTQDDD